mgnify:CR=1 FL=1
MNNMKKLFAVMIAAVMLMGTAFAQQIVSDEIQPADGSAADNVYMRNNPLHMSKNKV